MRNMRILLVNSGFSYSTKDVGLGYEEAFKSLGFEINTYPLEHWLEYFTLSERLVSALKNKQSHKSDINNLACSGILDVVIKTEPDLVVFIHGGNIHTDIPWEIQKIGVQCALILTDEPQEIDISLGYSHAYRYVFSNDRNTVDEHRKNAPQFVNNFGPPYSVEFLPTAVSHNFCNFVEADKLPNKYKSDILFAGSMYPERLKWLMEHKELLSQYNCLIIGPGRARVEDTWLNTVWVNEKLSHEDMAKYMVGTKVFLDVPRDETISYPYGPQNSKGIIATNLSPRLYEAALAGCVILTNSTRDDIKTEFENCAIVYTEESLPEILPLALDGTFEPMARLAKQMVLNKHTYKQRAAKVLNTVGNLTAMTWHEVKDNINQIANDKACGNFSELWKTSFEINKEMMISNASLFEYKNQLSGYTGIVISNGPSLELTLDKLCDVLKTKNESDKIISIATNGAYKTLTERNIFTDFFTIIHPENNQYERQIKGTPKTTTTKLLVSSVVHPSTWQQWPGDVRFFHTAPNFEINKQLLESINLSVIEGGVTVATLACGILAYMGCSRIIFVGQDFAYTRNKKYMNVPFKATEAASRLVTVSDDIHGNATLTDITLHRSHEIIIDFSKKYSNIEFINASQEGILKGGNIKICSLEELFPVSQ